MMTFNPFKWQITPYGLLDWYRYLNLGYQVPVVGGSDKMSADALLGGIRTYAHLGARDFSYENWMAAVKTGNTFVTVGPLLELAVEGRPPGQPIEPAGRRRDGQCQLARGLGGAADRQSGSGSSGASPSKNNR